MLRNIVRIILIAAILIGLVFLGRTIYNNFFNPNRANNSSSTPPATATPTGQVNNAATGSATASSSAFILTNKTVYESISGKFRFRYPENWSFVNTTPHAANSPYGAIIDSWTITSYTDTTQGANGVNSNQVPPETIRINFEISQGGMSRSLDEISYCTDTGVIDCQNAVINGVPSKRVVRDVGLKQPAIYFYTIYGNQILRVESLSNMENKQQSEQIINSVINTFEFLRA